MAETQLHLLKSRRFLPLFVTQFLGAVNDNLLKVGLVTLITFRPVTDPTTTKIVVAIATAIFIFPYFLFSATAGQIADRFEKAGLIRLVKLWEVGVMVLAAIGFAFTGDTFVFFELAVLLFLGIQATFFGPVKYGILPDLLGTEDLMGGNALIEAGTFLAILVGTIAGGLLILLPQGEIIVSGSLLAFAAAGWAASLFIPRGQPAAPGLRLNANIWGETVAILRFANERRDLKLSILAISWFWLVGAVFLSQFPTYAKDTLGADQQVETLFLAMFSIGIGAGAVLCGGLFTVPLYALLQARSEESHRSRVVAANNIVNAIFIVVSGVVSALMLAAHLTVTQIFLVVGILNAVAAVVVMRLIPGVILKTLLAALFRLVYRVEVKGIENYRKAGERVVIVANHLSFLDGPLLAAFLPGRPAFAINTARAQAWWTRPFLGLFDAVPIDPTKPLATKILIRAVEQGRRCVIFPEGRITVTGALMKIYEGPGMIADKAKATILPVRIDGPQFTRFSRLKGKLRRRWSPPVTITLQEPQVIALPDEIKGRKRRREIGLRLYDVMSAMMFETAE